MNVSQTINWEYLTDRVRRYNENPTDDLLYRIGSHVDALTPADCELINNSQKGWLAPEQRYRVLNWLAVKSGIGFVGLDVELDLALLIFGRNQLSEWLETSRRAYPDFEFYLPFEYLEGSKTGWETGINFSMYWMPKPGAPVPDPECDFPWKLSWDLGEMFWGNLPNGTKNDFEFTLAVYPNQQNFTIPGSICEAGDWYTTLTDEEKDLMSVAQVLQHFAVPA
jgi:hypothetical protein